MRGRGYQMLSRELSERHTDPLLLTISGEGFKIFRVLFSTSRLTPAMQVLPVLVQLTPKFQFDSKVLAQIV